MCPVFLIVFILTLLLVRGVKESAGANNVMVMIKIGAILTFLVVGGMLVNPANWTPFAPSGFAGIVTGGAIVFFTYIGFDSVSTAAEECKDSAARPAFRNHRVADHLHDSLRRRCHRAAGHDEVHDIRFRRSGGSAGGLCAEVTGRAPVLPLGDRRGRADWDDFFAAGLSVRAGAHLVCHVARRPAAQAFFRRASQDSRLHTGPPGLPALRWEFRPGWWISETPLIFPTSARLFAFVLVSLGVILSATAASPIVRAASAFRSCLVPVDLRRAPGRPDDRPHSNYVDALLRVAGLGDADLLRSIAGAIVSSHGLPGEKLLWMNNEKKSDRRGLVSI